MPQHTYVSIRELHDTNQPAIVERYGPHIHVAWDPRSLRLDITAHLLDILTRDEQERVAAGLGFGFPLPEWTTALRPAYLYVPPALRLPGASAFQGGDELWRRQGLGLLTLERAAYRAEVMGHTVDLQMVDDLAYA